MAQSTLDTHAPVVNLEATGTEREQAEAIVETIRRADSSLATKADIVELAAATKVDVTNLAAATKAEVTNLAAATKAEVTNLAAATKAEVTELRAELKTRDARTSAQIADLRTEITRGQYRILLAMAGLMVGLMGLLFAALRLTG